MNNLVRLIQTGYNHEEPQLRVRVAVLEDRMEKTLQMLATKTELKEVEGNLKTEIQKEQKSTRNLLLSIGGGIIATVLGSHYFAGKDTQVVYVPQHVSQQSIAPSSDTDSEINELREHLMDIKMKVERMSEVDKPTVISEPSD